MSRAVLSAKLRDAIIAATRDPKVGSVDLAKLADQAISEHAPETARAVLAVLIKRAGSATTAAPGAPGASPAAAAAPATSGDAAEGPLPAVPTNAPIPGVDPEAWQKLVDVLARGEDGEERELDASERGRVGRYAFSVKRLADLGLVAKPRQTGTGASRTWTGDWAPGAREKFVASEALQRAALARSSAAYAAQVRKTALGRALGKLVNGHGITLSGLVAVAHVAGSKGLESWLRDARVRGRFPATTELFERANGIF